MVISTPVKRNYTGIMIAGLVIAMIIGMVMMAVYLLSPKVGHRTERPMKREDIQGMKKQHNYTWISGERFQYLSLFSVSIR